MITYRIVRDGNTVAHAVTLPNGKCVVSWPTSTIVYDSEKAARAVHIDHMGGRGEPTEFLVSLISTQADRGWLEAYQDRCEGCPCSAINFHGRVICPDYVPEDARKAFVLGYESYTLSQFGTKFLEPWTEKMRFHHAISAGRGEAAEPSRPDIPWGENERRRQPK